LDSWQGLLGYKSDGPGFRKDFHKITLPLDYKPLPPANYLATTSIQNTIVSSSASVSLSLVR
jgi:hypothetical protein